MTRMFWLIVLLSCSGCAAAQRHTSVEAVVVSTPERPIQGQTSIKVDVRW